MLQMLWGKCNEIVATVDMYEHDMALPINWHGQLCPRLEEC